MNNQQAVGTRSVTAVVNRIHELSESDIIRIDLALEQRRDAERKRDAGAVVEV